MEFKFDNLVMKSFNTSVKTRPSLLITSLAYIAGVLTKIHARSEVFPRNCFGRRTVMAIIKGLN